MDYAEEVTLLFSFFKARTQDHKIVLLDSMVNVSLATRGVDHEFKNSEILMLIAALQLINVLLGFLLNNFRLNGVANQVQILLADIVFQVAKDTLMMVLNVLVLSYKLELFLILSEVREDLSFGPITNLVMEFIEDILLDSFGDWLHLSDLYY